MGGPIVVTLYHISGVLQCVWHSWGGFLLEELDGLGLGLFFSGRRDCNAVGSSEFSGSLRVENASHEPRWMVEWTKPGLGFLDIFGTGWDPFGKQCSQKMDDSLPSGLRFPKLPISANSMYIYYSWMNFFNKNLARALFARNFEDIFVLVACPDRDEKSLVVILFRPRSLVLSVQTWDAIVLEFQIQIRSGLATWIGWLHWQNNHKPDGESGNHWWN